MEKKIVVTKNAPEAIGPYSQGVVAGNFLFCSGQIPIDPATGNQIKGSPREQAEQCLKNLKGIIQEAGASMDDVVKVTIYLTSMDFFKEVNEVYATFFTKNPPARATVAVVGLPLGFNVEMDAVVFLGK